MSIKAISVINTAVALGADCIVDKKGNANITGVPFTLTASNIQSVTRIPSQVGQFQKQIVTYTADNSYTYTITIEGNNTTTGSPLSQTVSYISDTTGTSAEISAGVTALVNGFSGFSVSATDSGSGVVALAGTAAYPTFTVYENDAKIAVTAMLTAAVGAPTSTGATATMIPIVSNAGAVTGAIITNGGSGYMAAPNIILSGGAGSSGALVAIISNGSVVAVTLTAGSGYTCRMPIAVAGTPAAILLKYDNPSTTNTANAYAFASLANLTSGYTYTEWQINYNSFVGGGKPNFAQTTNLDRVVVLVYEDFSVNTLVNTLNSSSWGTLANLSQGYRCEMIAAGADVAVATNVATRNGGSFLTELLRGGDLIGNNVAANASNTALSGASGNLCAEVLIPYAASTTALALTATSALVTGSDITSAAAYVVHRYSLPV